jgi:hypothetical protein
MGPPSRPPPARRPGRTRHTRPECDQHTDTFSSAFPPDRRKVSLLMPGVQGRGAGTWSVPAYSACRLGRSVAHGNVIFSAHVTSRAAHGGVPLRRRAGLQGHYSADLIMSLQPCTPAAFHPTMRSPVFSSALNITSHVRLRSSTPTSTICWHTPCGRPPALNPRHSSGHTPPRKLAGEKPVKTPDFSPARGRGGGQAGRLN